MPEGAEAMPDDGAMAREPRSAAANAGHAASPPASAGTEEESVIEERGSFSHAVCRVCGWAGPGRRSRQVARGDATQHVEAEHVATDDDLLMDEGAETGTSG
jgi:hypothetical protein